MATATAEPKKAADTDALLALLGESYLPLAEVLAAAPPEVLGRAWAAGDVEFGVTKHIMTNAPGGDDPRKPQRVGPTLVVETGIDWSGKKEKWHAASKDIVAGAKLPKADFYQHYRQEVCVNKAQGAWQWLGEGEDPGLREVRWVRCDCSRAVAEKLFNHYVKLTDKGLAKLS